MTCSLCNGTELTAGVIVHPQTGIKKAVSSPCYCFISKVVSSENKLLQHLGDQYDHPDNLDPMMLLDETDRIPISKNYIIDGSYDSFVFKIKSLLMKYRFDIKRPKILFSRSIDIVHEYHVPQGDGNALHLSATSKFDLIVTVFGVTEVNKALSPCMTELVKTRVQEKKPTWIYFSEVFSPKIQEYSEELANILTKEFERIEVHSDKNIENKGPSVSKKMASKF